MKKRSASALRLLCLPLVCLGLATALAAELKDLRPESTEALGQKFPDKKAGEALRVLIVGSGSSHNFPKYFIGADSETLKAQPGLEVAATLNATEALSLLPAADVLVFSGNDGSFGTVPFQKALTEFAEAGKGIVLLHAAAWAHPWPGYNKRFVGGSSKGHGYGEFEVSVKQAGHPVMKGVPGTFKITDESYHHEFVADAAVELLAENAADDKTRKPHASVWVVKDPKARIVCITLGHAREAHENPAYKTLLTNAVNWAAGR